MKLPPYFGFFLYAVSLECKLAYSQGRNCLHYNGLLSRWLPCVRSKVETASSTWGPSKQAVYLCALLEIDNVVKLGPPLQCL